MTVMVQASLDKEESVTSPSITPLRSNLGSTVMGSLLAMNSLMANTLLTWNSQIMPNCIPLKIPNCILLKMPNCIPLKMLNYMSLMMLHYMAQISPNCMFPIMAIYMPPTMTMCINRRRRRRKSKRIQEQPSKLPP
jgi:hypothetical protein